jgi:hypothetical protein
MRKPTLLALIVLAAGVLATGAAAQDAHDAHAHHAPTTDDTSYAAMQARGKQAMGVDQYTSTHQFVALPDGGRIELVRSSDDSAGVSAIRRHLREVAQAFKAGDFSTPAFVHLQQVPGTAVMAARRSAITYTVGDVPGGAALRMTTADSAALTAIHEFLGFQAGAHHPR